MTSLIYIADPMCSWCYGFGPELVPLLQGLPEVPVEIIVGGLRVTPQEPMNDALKSTLAGHWDRVKSASGLPFNSNILERSDFIYNTEPACRAVVTTRLLAPEAILQVFCAIQHAFYAEGLDTTQGNVLADVAARTLKDAGIEIDAATFYAKWESPEAIAATQQDFSLTRQWDVTGFPTVALERNGKLDLVCSGYASLETLISRLQTLVDQAA
jgi:putative protein-disulfide isomerase